MPLRPLVFRAIHFATQPSRRKDAVKALFHAVKEQYFALGFY